MKKSKILSFLTLPLLLGTSSVLVASNISKNEVEIERRAREGELDEIVNRGQVKDVAYGASFSSMVITDALGNDHLYTWGKNDYGQLGLGATSSSYVGLPTEIIDFPLENYKIKNIEAGDYNMGAVLTDSSGVDHLYVWGKNDWKQVLNSSNEVVAYPVEITSLQGDIKDFDFGQSNVGVVRTDSMGYDHLYTWGYGSKGQLGNGSYANTSSVGEITSKFSLGSQITIEEFEASSFHSGAIVVDDFGVEHVFLWGRNYYGQIGNGKSYANGYQSAYWHEDEPYDITSKFSNYSHFSDIGLGDEYSSIVVTDLVGNDSVYTWGYGGGYRLGSGSTSKRTTPGKVDSLPSGQEVVSLSVGATHSGALMRDANTGTNSLYIWGCNSSGEHGLGNTTTYKNPNFIFSTKNDIEIKMGYHFSSASIIDANGDENFYVWGNNEYGQFGLGMSSDYSAVPVEDDVLANNDSVFSTTFIEKTANDKFKFQVSTTETDPSTNGNDVLIYNSKGVEVGTTKLKENKTLRAGVSTYVFDATVTDFDNSSDELLYWSLDGGKTLSLISNDTYKFGADNNNVIIYSSVGIGFVILMILIIIFVVVLLFGGESSEKENKNNRNDYLDSNEKKPKREKKSKKQREQDIANQRNNVLDAF